MSLSQVSASVAGYSEMGGALAGPSSLYGGGGVPGQVGIQSNERFGVRAKESQSVTSRRKKHLDPSNWKT